MDLCPCAIGAPILLTMELPSMRGLGPKLCSLILIAGLLPAAPISTDASEISGFVSNSCRSGDGPVVGTAGVGCVPINDGCPQYVS